MSFSQAGSTSFLLDPQPPGSKIECNLLSMGLRNTDLRNTDLRNTDLRNVAAAGLSPARSHAVSEAIRDLPRPAGPVRSAGPR
jgi:hypothetical protein